VPRAGAVVPRSALPMACRARRGSSLRRATGDQFVAALPVSSVRLERTLPRYSGACLLPLGYEDLEPPTGLEPATSAIRERRSTC
jgi:hypothetical protein